MTKPLNPAVYKQKLEYEYKKKIEDIKNITEDRDFIIAKVAFTATISIFVNSTYTASKFNLADKFQEIYIIIKDKETTQEMLDAINAKYNSSVALSELQFLYPKDFMTYSSM